MQFPSDVVKAFEGADGCGAHSDALSAVVDEFLDGLTFHHDVFGVHVVVRNLLALHRLEGAGTLMEGDLLTVDTFGIDSLEYPFCEMETSRWCSHRAFDLGIDRLIGA